MQHISHFLNQLFLPEGLMASINRVTLIGNLGQDPDTRYMPDGGAVTNISIATTQQWKDKGTGAKQERTEWHRIVFYGRLAEVAGEYLKKGRSVYVEGHIRTRKWQDQNGTDRYATEIIASMLEMLGNKQDGQDSEGAGDPAKPAPGTAAGGDNSLETDDIPF